VTEHWRRVKEHLETAADHDPMRGWCCTLNGHHAKAPPPPRAPVPLGRWLVEYNYQQMCQDLRTAFPFSETAPCQCAVCTVPEPKPCDPWEEGDPR
jgi:hypothetical protein